jgi:hypothetical protein
MFSTTSAVVGIVLDDLHVVRRCVLADDLQLVFRRILLTLGRHADVLSRARGARAVTEAEVRSMVVTNPALVIREGRP